MVALSVSLKPPLNENPLADDGQHTQAWATYHQRVADRVENVEEAVRTGTTTDDDAAAGQIGEYISAEVDVGSALALASGVALDVTSISLTAGDWEVGGNVVTAPAGSTQTAYLMAAVSTTSGALPAPNGGAFAMIAGTTAAGRTLGAPTGNRRLSLAATTTVFLVTQSQFTSGANAAYGFIGARRVR